MAKDIEDKEYEVKMTEVEHKVVMEVVSARRSHRDALSDMASVYKSTEASVLLSAMPYSGCTMLPFVRRDQFGTYVVKWLSSETPSFVGDLKRKWEHYCSVKRDVMASAAYSMMKKIEDAKAGT